MTFVLTEGQRHDTVAFKALMEQGAVKRQGPGRPRIRPRRICADKAYRNRWIRCYLRRRGIRYTIPHKTDQRRRGPFDKAIYKTRNRVERLFNRLKQNRRLATRYEKTADNFLAMLHIASVLLWL